MFDERRQRVTGIDKSYPLQPISSKVVTNNSGRQIKNTVMRCYFILQICCCSVCLSRMKCYKVYETHICNFLIYAMGISFFFLLFFYLFYSRPM